MIICENDLHTIVFVVINIQYKREKKAIVQELIKPNVTTKRFHTTIYILNKFLKSHQANQCIINSSRA